MHDLVKKSPVTPIFKALCSRRLGIAAMSGALKRNLRRFLPALNSVVLLACLVLCLWEYYFCTKT